MDTGRISDSGDSSSTLDGSIFTVKSDTPMLNVKQPKFRYGWCKFAPKFLQKLNNPKWLLVCLCVCAICQGMLINAFVPVAMTTLEKRFQFSAFQLGLFVSCYDVAILVVQLPVCYFGERGHKARWLAIGMFLMALGSAICVVPQFISGIYRYEANVTQPEICKTEETPQVATKSFEETILFYVFFLIGQILHGIGASPLYTLGVTYLNENVHKDSSPMYLGVFFGCSVLGPAIGYIVGGLLLRIYGDVWKVDLDMIKITYEDVRWYGAWWICFMITSGMAVISSLMISGFARQLPNAPVHPEMAVINKENEHHHHHHRNDDKHSQTSTSISDSYTVSSLGVKGMWRAFQRLMKCKTWLCLLVVDCLEGLPSTGIVAFFPKIVENFFAIDSSTASLLTGCAIVPAAFLGNILGGFFIRKYHLQVSGMMVFALIFDGMAYFSILAFLAQCPRPLMAGVTVPYGFTEGAEEEILNVKPNLSHDCNMNCHCSKTLYNPVCDSNRSVIYYSACFAGCESQANGEFKDCNCLIEPYVNTSTLASPLTLSNGFCPKQCYAINIFLVFFAILVFTSFMTAIPIQESQLRTVPFELRTFAFGIRWIFVRLFGTIPGPLLFGYLVDQSCILWTQATGEVTRKVKCVIYDNPQLGYAIITGGMVFKFIVIVFLYLARRVYLKSGNESHEIMKNESNVSLKTNDSSNVSTSSFT